MNRFSVQVNHHNGPIEASCASGWDGTVGEGGRGTTFQTLSISGVSAFCPVKCKVYVNVNIYLVFLIFFDNAIWTFELKLL